MEYCYLQAYADADQSQLNDAKDNPSSYCLRRNYMTYMNFFTSLTTDEKRYCMGHMNRDTKGYDMNLAFNHEDRRHSMLPKLDQWLTNLKLHEPLITHPYTKPDESYEIVNTSVLKVKIPGTVLPNGGTLQVIIHKKEPEANFSITQISTPRMSEAPPNYEITSQCVAPTDPVKLDPPNMQYKYYQILSDMNKRSKPTPIKSEP